MSLWVLLELPRQIRHPQCRLPGMTSILASHSRIVVLYPPTSLLCFAFSYLTTLHVPVWAKSSKHMLRSDHSRFTLQVWVVLRVPRGYEDNLQEWERLSPAKLSISLEQLTFELTVLGPSLKLIRVLFHPYTCFILYLIAWDWRLVYLAFGCME